MAELDEFSGSVLMAAHHSHPVRIEHADCPILASPRVRVSRARPRGISALFFETPARKPSVGNLNIPGGQSTLAAERRHLAARRIRGRRAVARAATPWDGSRQEVGRGRRTASPAVFTPGGTRAARGAERTPRGSRPRRERRARATAIPDLRTGSAAGFAPRHLAPLEGARAAVALPWSAAYFLARSYTIPAGTQNSVATLGYGGAMTTQRKRAPSEAPLPSRWLRSSTGAYAYVVHCAKRDNQGRRLYRLRWIAHAGAPTSVKTWTADELLASGCRWLQRKPSTRVLRESV